MSSSKQDQPLPQTFTVKEAAKLLGMTSGGLRGAILRGKLRADKIKGQHIIKSYNLAAFHLYGDNRTVSEDTMTPKKQLTLHDYLETMTRA
jgi:hypothetical protein